MFLDVLRSQVSAQDSELRWLASFQASLSVCPWPGRLFLGSWVQCRDRKGGGCGLGGRVLQGDTSVIIERMTSVRHGRHSGRRAFSLWEGESDYGGLWKLVEGILKPWCFFYVRATNIKLHVRFVANMQMPNPVCAILHHTAPGR